MAKTVTPFLMFQGRAEEAMTLYVSLFEGASIEGLMKFPAADLLSGGKVMMATLVLKGQRFRVNDSMVGHQFGFTPSFSIFVECDSVEELDRVFAALGEGGEVLMEADNHGFSPRFGWVQDRFGVSWQLNLGGVSL